jgi:hypothetical protein
MAGCTGETPGPAGNPPEPSCGKGGMARQALVGDLGLTAHDRPWSAGQDGGRQAGPPGNFFLRKVLDRGSRIGYKVSCRWGREANGRQTNFRPKDLTVAEKLLQYELGKLAL